MKKLWMDESGAILSVELILIMVMVVIGLVVGLKALRDAVVAKLADVAAAVAAIDPGYGYGGITYLSVGTGQFASADGAWVAGSQYESTMAFEGGWGAGIYTPEAVLTSEVAVAGTAPIIVSSQ